MNSGTLAAAGGTSVAVTFDGSADAGGTALLPELAPGGGSALLSYKMPPSCLSDGGRCSFTVVWSNQPPLRGECIIVL